MSGMKNADRLVWRDEIPDLAHPELYLLYFGQPGMNLW